MTILDRLNELKRLSDAATSGMTTNKHMGSSFSDFVAQSDAEFLAAVREGIARNAITPDEDIVRLIAMVERDTEMVMFRHRLIAAECSEKGAYLHRIEGMKAEIALALTRIAEILEVKE